MGVIDKTIIDNFAEFDAENQSYIQALNFAQNLLENSLNEIAKANPYVTKDNTTILPAGAFYSNCILPSSSLDLLLVVNNSEIILNTHSLFKSKWSVFKNKLTFAWKNRKKKKKKRKKKQKGSEEAALNFIDHKDNYNILSLSKDLVKAISKHITINDIVHLQAGVLIVQGENVPYKIRIFPVLEKEELSFQFFQYTKTKLIGFSLKEHHNNLENLIENFGEKYPDQVKIFAGLYSHLIKQTINPNKLILLLIIRQEFFLGNSLLGDNLGSNVVLVDEVNQNSHHSNNGSATHQSPIHTPTSEYPRWIRYQQHQ